MSIANDRRGANSSASAITHEQGKHAIDIVETGGHTDMEKNGRFA